MDLTLLKLVVTATLVLMGNVFLMVDAQSELGKTTAILVDRIDHLR